MTRLGFAASIAVVLVLVPGGRASAAPATPQVELTASAQLAPSDAATPAIRRILGRFLHALTRGNLRGMRTWMTPGLYAQYQTLFEQNREYPKFLRKFYRGATLSVGTITITDRDAKAEIPIAWSDGRTTTATVTLVLDAGGQWKISRLFD